MRSDRFAGGKAPEHEGAADDTPGSDLDEYAARFLRSAWKSSPGIVLSLIFHGAMLALLPLIIFSEKVRESLGIPVTIGLNARRVDPERPYRPIESGPPAVDGRGLDEPPVFMPDAIDAERNEARGDSEENAAASRAILQHVAEDQTSAGFRGRLGKGPPGTNDVMGVGGGSGTGGAKRGAGPRGTMFGRGAGRMNLVARGGGSKETEEAVELGLSWLCRHQCSDGSWAPTRCAKCKSKPEDLDGYVVSPTALGALAFMIAGYGPNSQVAIRDRATGRTLKYGDTVRSALSWLAKNQAMASQNMYEHSFLTMAFCEAFRETRSDEDKTRALNAVRYLLHAQNPGSAWQYTPRCGMSDTSVTGACVQALRAARMAGIEVPQSAYDGIGKFLHDVDNSDGSWGYIKAGGSSGALTAIGLYSKRFLDQGSSATDRSLPLAAKKVAAAVGNGEFSRDLYTWYYAMLGLFELEGPQGASWKSVNAAVTTALVKSQHREEGCVEGAWDGAMQITIDGPGAVTYNFGRPLFTAIAVLTLETYYRYVEGAEVHEKTPVALGADPPKKERSASALERKADATAPAGR